jgi:hypothetical protein
VRKPIFLVFWVKISVKVSIISFEIFKCFDDLYNIM